MYVLRKQSNQKYLKYAHVHTMIFLTTRFHQIPLRGFRGVSLTNKKKRTDGRVKSIIVAWGMWGIIKLNRKIHLCHGSFYVSLAIGYQMRFVKYRSG